jgi:hypothetical protein
MGGLINEFLCCVFHMSLPPNKKARHKTGQKSFSGILLLKSAYAIMPVGKKIEQVHVGQQTKTRRCTRPSGFLFLFFNGKA